MKKHVHVNNPVKGQKGFQPIPISRRFWAKVIKTKTCWLWGGRCGPDGYGHLTSKIGENRAHRWAYILLVGPIPVDMFVLHRCDNPPCVNPKHLFLGTQADNVRDMIEKGRAPYQTKFGGGM